MGFVPVAVIIIIILYFLFRAPRCPECGAAMQRRNTGSLSVMDDRWVCDECGRNRQYLQ